jgi:phage terminase large subunit GpA-like protein
LFWLVSRFVHGLKEPKPGKHTPELWECEREALRPPSDLDVSEWSDANRVLQPGTSRSPGPWRTSNTPYLEEVMNSYSDPEIRHTVFCAGTQLGKTEALFNILGYIVDVNPFPTMVLYPRDTDCKIVSKTRIQPMLRGCPSTAKKIPSKRDDFGLREMLFPGSPVYLVGSNSAAGMAQKPCRNVLRDEIDKYPDYVSKDAGPLGLSEERVKSFWDMRKIFDVSSPTIEERGIWKMLGTCDGVKEFFIACPHCGVEQTLKMSQIVWDECEKPEEKATAARDTAQYQCEGCAGIIKDSDKLGLMQQGRWMFTTRKSGTIKRIGFRISSLYSPWLTWGDIAEQFVKANIKAKEGDFSFLQNFVNGWLAEPWVVKVETVSEDVLEQRKIDLPPFHVPADTVGITMGIDTQKIGFYCTAWAWSKHYRSHCAFHSFLPDWDDVKRAVFGSEFILPDGSVRHVWRAGIDSGGGKTDQEWTRTEEVYHWVRENGRGILWATKGLGQNSQAGTKVRHTIVDKLPSSGVKIPDGLVLWLIDPNLMKEVFFWRLQCDPQGDKQSVTFHSEAGRKLFRQIMSEEKRRNKDAQIYWHQIRPDNHYLDTSIIAHACADPQWAGGIRLLAQIVEADQERKQRQGDRDARDGQDWINDGNLGNGWPET